MPSSDLGAHALHTSYAEIARDRSGRLTISIKVFNDDFQSALAQFAQKEGLPPNGDNRIRRYVERAFLVRAPDDSPVALSWCGVRTEGNQLIICAMTDSAVRGTVRLSNSLLFERFSDQINIVRWIAASATRTVVLTQRSSEAILGAVPPSD
jgi:hypothetical protein